jgi:AraC-like DNA-binding protein
MRQKAKGGGVINYAEHPPAPALDGLVKAFWRLEAHGDAGAWIDHQAVPDGCVEIIARTRGRSRWGGEQPALFAAGYNDAPVTFAFSGDACFVAARLWPWAWPFVCDLPLAAIRNLWAPIAAPAFATIAEAEAVLADRLRGAPVATVGRAILAAASVADMRARAGLSPRALQRWFETHVGLPPRRYLALLRFQKAFADMRSEGSLADHAAGHGFADQAHMARAFRGLAGVPAGQARRRAKGPFLR